MQEVSVEHDEAVNKNEVLLVQRSPELEKEIATADGEFNQTMPS